jgi:hypothetical protein
VGGKGGGHLAIRSQSGNLYGIYEIFYLI